MPNLTTANLVDRCELRFGDPSGHIVTATDWLDYLNDAYNIANYHNPFWPWMEIRDSTVAFAAGTNTYATGTDKVWRVQTVHNTTDGYPLYPLDGTESKNDWFPEQSDQGSPVVYRMFNSTLEIYPIPDHAVNMAVEYRATPAVLVSGSANPVWPDEFRQILVEGALSLAYRDDGNDNYAERHLLRFEKGLEKMEEAILSGNRMGTYQGIADNWF